MRTSRLHKASNWVLGCTMLFGLSRASAVFAVDTSLSAVIPQTQTFVVSGGSLAGHVGCGLVDGTHYYDTQAIVVTVDGDYTFWGTSASLLPIGGNDSFLALYQGQFDPLAPTAHLLGCDDDSLAMGRTLLPEFALTGLVAGQVYVLMNTTFDEVMGGSDSYGTVNLTVSGPGAVTVVNNPTVTTQAATSVGHHTATGHGAVTALNGSTVYERGFCWGPSLNPDIYGSKVTQSGSFNTGAFTGALTGLSSGTTYHVRAYAANASGYSYGTDVTLTTTGTQPIPTLNEWGMMIFGALLVVVMIYSARNHQPTNPT